MGKRTNLNIRRAVTVSWCCCPSSSSEDEFDLAENYKEVVTYDGHEVKESQHR